MVDCFCRAVCGAIISLSVSAYAADWPQFRGPNGTGISSETGINKSWKTKPPEVLWTMPLSDDGFAGPAVAEGKVFIIDHKRPNDVVRALDINTGEQLWAFQYPEIGGSNYGFARSTPAINGGKVYTLSRSGLLHCLSAADGAKVWSRNIIADFHGRPPKWQVAASPIIDGDKLIVAPGGQGAAVVALDKNTGNTIWQGGGSDRCGYATPVIATIGEKKQYVVFTGVSLIGVDIENGKLLWRFPWKTNHDVNAAMPIVHRNFIFITSGYRHGCALVKIVRGKAVPAWENKEMQAHFSSPILYKGHFYGTGDPGFLMCLDPKTGKALWKKRGFEKGGIIAVDGTIIGLNGRGGDLIMAALSSEAYRELGRIKPLGGQSWTAPVIAGGKLIVRNKKALACIDLR